MRRYKWRQASREVTSFFLLCLLLIHMRTRQGCLSWTPYDYFPLGPLGRAHQEKHENVLQMWICHQDRSTRWKSRMPSSHPHVLCRGKEWPWFCLWMSMALLNSFLPMSHEAFLGDIAFPVSLGTKTRAACGCWGHFYTLKCPLWDIYSKLAFCPFTVTALLELVYKQKKKCQSFKTIAKAIKVFFWS